VVGRPRGSGVNNRRDDWLGRAVTGNFRTTNLGVVMAESGLCPAESLLNNRSRRHVLRLMSLSNGNQAKSLPGAHGTAHGSLQRVLRPGGGDRPTRRTEHRSLERTPPSPTQSGRSRKQGRRTSNLGLCSEQMGHGTKTGRRDTRWYGGRGGAGRGGRPIWGITKRPTTRSAPPSRVLSKLRRSGPSSGDSAGCGSLRGDHP